MAEWPRQNETPPPAATFNTSEVTRNEAPGRAGGARAAQFISDLLANTSGDPGFAMARSLGQISKGLQDQDTEDALRMYNHVFQTGEVPQVVESSGFFGGTNTRPLRLIEKTAANQAIIARRYAEAKAAAEAQKETRANLDAYGKAFGRFGEAANRYVDELGDVEPVTEEEAPFNVYSVRRNTSERMGRSEARADERLDLSKGREGRVSQPKPGAEIDLVMKGEKYVASKLKEYERRLETLRSQYDKLLTPPSGATRRAEDADKIAELERRYDRILREARGTFKQAYGRIASQDAASVGDAAETGYEEWVQQQMSLLGRPEMAAQPQAQAFEYPQGPGFADSLYNNVVEPAMSGLGFFSQPREPVRLR